MRTILPFLLASVGFFVAPASSAEVDKERCLAAPTSVCLLLVARNMAERIGWPSMRVELFTNIALAQKAAGEVKEMRKSMALAELSALQARRVEPTHGRKVRAAAWAKVVAAWAKVDEPYRALHFLEAGPDEDARLYATEALVEMRITARDLAGALELATAVGDPLWRVRLATPILDAQIDAGALRLAHQAMAVAVEAANKIPDPELRADYLAGLGHQQARSGNIDEALQTAARIVGYRNHDWLVRQIALVQARNGEYEMARDTMHLVPDGVSLVLGLSRSAEIAVKAGHREQAEAFFGEALALSLAMPIGEKRDNAIGHVAEYRADVGDHDNALEAVSEIAGDFTHDWKLLIVLRELIESGNLAKASTLPARMRSIRNRANSRIDIAAGHAKAGNRATAKQFFGAAMELALDLTETWLRDSTLLRIAEHQATVGEFDDALQTATALNEGFYAPSAIGKIATEMARAGRSADALRLVKRIDGSMSATYALVEIAKALAGSK